MGYCTRKSPHFSFVSVPSPCYVMRDSWIRAVVVRPIVIQFVTVQHCLLSDDPWFPFQVLFKHQNTLVTCFHLGKLCCNHGWFVKGIMCVSAWAEICSSRSRTFTPIVLSCCNIIYNTQQRQVTLLSWKWNTLTLFFHLYVYRFAYFNEIKFLMSFF